MNLKTCLIGFVLGLLFFLSIPWLVVGFYKYLDWVFNLVGRP